MLDGRRVSLHLAGSLNQYCNYRLPYGQPKCNLSSYSNDFFQVDLASTETLLRISEIDLGYWWNSCYCCFSAKVRFSTAVAFLLSKTQSWHKNTKHKQRNICKLLTVSQCNFGGFLRTGKVVSRQALIQSIHLWFKGAIMFSCHHHRCLDLDDIVF